MAAPGEKTLGVSEQRHTRLKIIAAKHKFRTISEALEKFGGPGIDAEFDRLEGGAPKSESTPRRKATAHKEQA